MSRFVSALSATLLVCTTALAQDIVLPDGKAKSLVQNSCTECHGLDQVVSNAMSRDEWRATVNRMVKRGATLSAPEIDSVVDYLSVYFAPDKINVNTATAKDLQSALGLTETQANAVVDYRTKNGKFTDVSGLLKAAGTDAKTMEAKKDLIVF